MIYIYCKYNQNCRQKSPESLRAGINPERNRARRRRAAGWIEQTMKKKET